MEVKPGSVPAGKAGGEELKTRGPQRSLAVKRAARNDVEEEQVTYFLVDF